MIFCAYMHVPHGGRALQGERCTHMLHNPFTCLHVLQVSVKVQKWLTECFTGPGCSILICKQTAAVLHAHAQTKRPHHKHHAASGSYGRASLTSPFLISARGDGSALLPAIANLWKAGVACTELFRARAHTHTHTHTHMRRLLPNSIRCILACCINHKLPFIQRFVLALWASFAPLA